MQNGIRPEDVSKDETFNRRNDRNNHIIDKCDQESITHVENMDARDVQPRRKPRVLPGISPGDLSVKTTNTICKILKRVSDFIDDKRIEDETNSDWRDVAKTLDRLFLLIYSIVSLFVFFGFVVAILTQ